MTFWQFINEVRETFKKDIPDFCKERGIEPLKVVNTQFSLTKSGLTLAVFPTASSGSTITSTDGADLVRLTVMLYCNANGMETGVLQAEKYFSTVVQYLQKTRFGESSELVESVLCRMDEGEPVNGGVFLIEARINTHTDYGWD